MVKEKQYSVFWSHFAEKNLNDIYNYIKNDSPENAVNVVSEIIELSKSLAHFPFKFEECREIITKNKIYRKATITPYKIV